MPDYSAPPPAFLVDEGGFACYCTVSRLDDSAWAAAVTFEICKPAEARPPAAPKSHRVPGIFLDAESALAAAAAYAVRTVQWQRV